MRAQTKSLPKQKSQTTMTASNAVGNKRRKKTQTKRLDWETQRNRSTAHNRAELWCLYAHARCLCMSAAHLIFIRIWSTNCGFIFITRTINTPNKPTSNQHTKMGGTNRCLSFRSQIVINHFTLSPSVSIVFVLCIYFRLTLSSLYQLYAWTAHSRYLRHFLWTVLVVVVIVCWIDDSMDVNMRFDFSNYWYGNEVEQVFLPFSLSLSLILFIEAHQMPTFSQYPFFVSWPHWTWTIYVLHLFFSFQFVERTFHVKNCELTWIKGIVLYHAAINNLVASIFCSYNFSFILCQLSLEVVSFASRNEIEFRLACVSHTRFL